ncbi:hypothetical protein EK21DRAFT_51612 [Setomelanomma holmii]|uniref:Uncharacterized protein n=1 Tax=Setomelanomma holmii TaxID=210430 RepID=A0A9P4LUH1_9PLEO|nr:hypothetical protein EK21DRAFT_51612 [Setomelanomma holmii]
MVPSPRERAPQSPFRQTWDEADAAFLDPNSLPVARIPRGWERKQETKKTEEGRAKKIWRRFNLRSRASGTVQEASEEADEEEHDVRSRPVKKRQHMSPKAMEKTSSGHNGKKRAFKATRWDRRKSVLPRKNNSNTEYPITDAPATDDESDDAIDATNEDLSEAVIAEMDAATDRHEQLDLDLLPVEADRRATFTFTMDSEAVDDLPDYESLDGRADGNNQEPEESFLGDDATGANFFRSPVKNSSMYTFGSPEKIEYPKLPLSDTSIVESERPGAVEQAAGIMNLDEDMAEAEEISAHDRSAMTATGNEFEKISTSVSSAAPAISYPALPTDSVSSDPVGPESPSTAEEEHEWVVKDITPQQTASDVDENNEEPSTAVTEEDHVMVDDVADDDAEEEFTEASLQLNIQRDYEETQKNEQASLVPTVEEDSPSSEEDSNETVEEDEVHQNQSSHGSHIEHITDGLTLSFNAVKSQSREPTPRKLHSPPPPAVQSGPDDATITIAMDDDTALLKDFLNRAAASKAEKAAVLTHRRESLQNRRDSDVIRHALASPRKVLEDRDPNSPSKYDNELTLDLSQTLTLSMPTDASTSPTPGRAEQEGRPVEKSLLLNGSRRSSRAKKSRLPAPATMPTAQAFKIAIGRVDGSEHVVLKKSDAQELATITRANTRKNKQGAFNVTVRLLRLAADADKLPPLDDSTKEVIVGKNIRWDEQLAYYQENPETVAEAESLATPDELGMDDSFTTPSAKKSKVSRNSTPKIRRVKGLGTANGTPGKGLLAPASLLPDEVQDEKEAAQARVQQLPRPKASRIKKMPVATTTAATASTQADSKLPSLDIVPVGVEPTKERKSRLAAPKKVTLPQSTPPLAVEGKENAQRTGLTGATPKKGIPAPKVIVPPTVGMMESGLPRRRGRKI